MGIVPRKNPEHDLAEQEMLNKAQQVINSQAEQTQRANELFAWSLGKQINQTPEGE